jgi:hypothetical protein
MHTHPLIFALVLAAGAGAGALAPSAAIAQAATVDCRMDFSLSGWAIIYKEASGAGTITCSNGQRAAVDITVRGGGLAAGKFEIDDGQGRFSKVRDIAEVFGTYAQAEAQAGAVRSANAQALTKGEVSLALSGTGRGWDLGVSLGGFTIARR